MIHFGVKNPLISGCSFYLGVGYHQLKSKKTIDHQNFTMNNYLLMLENAENPSTLVHHSNCLCKPFYIKCTSDPTT